MKIIPLSEVTDIIKDDNTIAIAALSSANLPVALLKALVDHYDELQTPKNLTFMLANDISDYRGMVLI